MTMDLLALNVPPGVVRHGTDSQSEGRWRDVNFVRWTNGVLHPIGGWEQVSGVQITGSRVCRGAHSWRTNAGIPYIATGTYDKLYVLDGGGTLTDITPATFTSGNLNADENLSYGGKDYGEEAYGVARTSDGQTLGPTTWTLDNWGEDLVACSSFDKRILYWEGDVADDAATITASSGLVPTGNTGIIVTAERFLFALGADGNPRKIQWCDREDLTDWQPAVTNEAGDIELQTNGRIVCAEKVRGRTLILTDTDAHVATYQGPPTVYGFQRVASACGVVAPLVSTSISGMAFWMGESSFYMYNGSTVTPLPCDVHDYVFKDINHEEIEAAFCVPNQQNHEIWWFYPAAGSLENNRYVVFDYAENHWSIGTLGRSAGVDSGVFDNPRYIDDSGYFYRHEKGFNHGNASAYAETGPIRINQGNKVVKVNSVIPEEGTRGEADLYFKTRLYPNDTETTHGPYTTANPTDVRFTGRQVRVKVEGEVGADWRVGRMGLRAKEGGYR